MIYNNDEFLEMCKKIYNYFPVYVRRETVLMKHEIDLEIVQERFYFKNVSLIGGFQSHWKGK